MRKVILGTCLLLSPLFGKAQDAATQALSVSVASIIGIDFLNGGTNTGSVGESANLNFTTAEDLNAGMSTQDNSSWVGHRVRVQSTTNFMVTMKSSTAAFNPTNGATPGVNINTMLRLRLFDPTFSSNLIPSGYRAFMGGNIWPTPSTIVNNGPWGGNNQFSVAYIANPHWAHHAGTYTAEIQYTATNL